MMAIKLHTGLEGYLLLSGWVFAEQIGLPLPAAPILVAAGALAATGSLNFALLISAALSASLLADYLWYRAGAFRQSAVQRFKSRHRDSRVLRNAERLIERYGSGSLIFAKFIPGMSLAAPPLSGAYGITLTEFLLFDALGSLIWSASLVGIGYFSASRIKIGSIPVSSFTYLLICGAAMIGFAATKFAGPAWNYLSKRWRQAAVASRVTKVYTEAPPRLEWLTSQITGGVVSEAESALELLVPKEGENATFARWIRAWSRKLAIARALGTVAGELKSSARRMELADRAQLRKLVCRNWRWLSSISRVDIERGIAAIDLFPKAALLLTIFERLSLDDAAILLGVPKETVANAQAIALMQLSRALGGRQAWANQLRVQADPELKTLGPNRFTTLPCCAPRFNCEQEFWKLRDLTCSNQENTTRRIQMTNKSNTLQTKVVVTRYGGPDVITVAEQECPAPKPGEIRVKVLAAGVSLPDVLAREGVHPETPHVPYTPGWDLVGIVDQIGENVSGFELGQTVAAMPISGCYAQYVCLPQREFIRVPEGLDAAQAVALILNYITAYQMLYRSAKVKSGQRVLIHGASGGVGTAFLQLGAARRPGNVRNLRGGGGGGS